MVGAGGGSDGEGASGEEDGHESGTAGAVDVGVDLVVAAGGVAVRFVAEP